LFWSITNDEIEIAIEVQTSGWAALGFSKSGVMVQSDANIGWVDPSGVVNLNDYYISDRRGSCQGGSGICTDTQLGGTNDVLDFNGNHEGGTTQLIWKRKLQTGDTSNDVDITNSKMTVIWSYNPTDNTGFPLQIHSNKGIAIVNFFTGSVAKINTQLEVIHGGLMFVAWGVLVPLSSWLARHWKKFSWWFHVHRIINSIAIICVGVAFILICDVTIKHFSTAHMIIGLIIVISVFIQPFIGLVADRLYARWMDRNPGKDFRPFTPIWPDKIHWIVGWGTLLLALINILLGILLYDPTATSVIVIYIVYGCIIIGFLSVWAIVDFAKKMK